MRKRNGDGDTTPSLSIPRVVMFDLDGTLVDTMQIFAGVASRILACHAGLQIERACSLYLETSGIPFWEQLEIIVPDHPNKEHMASMFESEKIAATSDVVMSRPTCAALQTLRMHGISFGISSNNYQRNVQRFAALSEIEFEFALGCTPAMRKGRPHMDYVTEHFQCRPQDIVFVGDSHSDARMAYECGMRFIAVLTSFTRESFRERFLNVPCVDTVSCLPRLFGLTGSRHYRAEGATL